MERTAYELSASQVSTPPEALTLFWNIVGQYRSHFHRVLDLGAGDGRFAKHGEELFDLYDGVEIDKKRIEEPVSNRIRIFNRCAFNHPLTNYDACIGNPPYVRHHYLPHSWKISVNKKIQHGLDINLDLHCNLYVYFLCLSLLKSAQQGLVALLVPFEWVSRPSASPVRGLIERNKWNVSVYEFGGNIFPGVMTTASISVIDKSKSDGLWSFFNINPNFEVTPRKGLIRSGENILPYAKRGKIWAIRGVSPGTQKIFTLSESELRRAGLQRHDVSPCVTSLKNIPRTIKVLTRKVFHKYVVSAGHRCWLIKSNKPSKSKRLKKYLRQIPKKSRDTYTCRNQEPWFNFEDFSVPDLLFHSGFVKIGPKVILNRMRVRAVGSVYGITAPAKKSKLVKYLQAYNFENRVVPHSKALKKIEVKQLNGVLNEWQEAQS